MTCISMSRPPKNAKVMSIAQAENYYEEEPREIPRPEDVRIKRRRYRKGKPISR